MTKRVHTLQEICGRRLRSADFLLQALCALEEPLSPGQMGRVSELIRAAPVLAADIYGADMMRFDMGSQKAELEVSIGIFLDEWGRLVDGETSAFFSREDYAENIDLKF
jgi:hypothetical protein